MSVSVSIVCPCDRMADGSCCTTIAPASQEGLYRKWLVGKDQNSKFQERLLLYAYCSHTIIKEKNLKLNRHGTICVYRVWYYPRFQASSGGPGTYPPQIRENYYNNLEGFYQTKIQTESFFRGWVLLNTEAISLEVNIQDTWKKDNLKSPQFSPFVFWKRETSEIGMLL